MLPKWHALLGFLFSYIIYWFTSITILEASLIFFAAVFIDFDHYMWYVFKKKDLKLKNAYKYLKYHEKLTQKLMLFHTIEFHILIGLLGLIWSEFYYILIGMVFHSTSDLISLIYEKRLKVRIFSLIGELLFKNF